MSVVGSSKSPFTRRTAILLPLFGAMVFVALLWMIGAGLATGSANNGGSHAGAKGLNGFAAFAELLEAEGREVRLERTPSGFEPESLLVLTPDHYVDDEELERLIRDHRYEGPTLVILPKWYAVPLPAWAIEEEIGDGWVALAEAGSPSWSDDIGPLGTLEVETHKLSGSSGRSWRGFGVAGKLSAKVETSQSFFSTRYLPLVEDGRGRMLAGFMSDGSDTAAMAAASLIEPQRVEGSDLYPLIVVAEPDLLNNQGFADAASAVLGVSLAEAMGADGQMPVRFDLTLNGLGRSANLLTLAFTPPFLAATLCLLMALALVGWRAFVRFGPPRSEGPAIALGKAALVANAGGLIRRSGRLHLLGAPYLARSRERLAKALALGSHGDAKQHDAAIDRALAQRGQPPEAYSKEAAKLARARNPSELVASARALRTLEKELTR